MDFRGTRDDTWEQSHEVAREALADTVQGSNW